MLKIFLYKPTQYLLKSNDVKSIFLYLSIIFFTHNDLLNKLKKHYFFKIINRRIRFNLVSIIVIRFLF